MVSCRPVIENSSAHNTSTSDQFCHGKTWQYPWKSVDIATSKCFLFRGNYSVAIEMTPNLRRKRDNVLYFVICLSRRYIHAWPSLYPRLAVSVSMPSRRYIHALYKVFFLNHFRRLSDGSPCRFSDTYSLYPSLKRRRFMSLIRRLQFISVASPTA